MDNPEKRGKVKWIDRLNKVVKMDYRSEYILILIFIILAFTIGDYREIPQGMVKIVLSNSTLITDYIELAGISATFINVAIVTLATMELMRISKLKMNGKTIFTLSLMIGFSFWGKNIFNMWFILLGTFIHSVLNKQRFSDNLISGLLATSLGPIISTTFLSNGIDFQGVVISIVCGIVIGFVVVPMAKHTNSILKGLNLYNGGFAVGLIALIITPLLISYDFAFESKTYWATGYNTLFGPLLYISGVVIIIIGYLSDKENAFKNYLNILKRPGVPKDDFTELDGMGAVFVNMGINIILSVTYILFIGGDLNGPVIGCIITIAGFSANGKHAKNMIPVFLGITLGRITNRWLPTAPTAQLATLLGTTLVPISGTYGFLAGVVAGFIHSSVVLRAGLGYAGANLYNNGFSGGIVSIVMYPLLSKYVKNINTYDAPSESRKHLFENGDSRSFKQV